MPLMLPVLVKLQCTARGPPGDLPVILIFVVVLVGIAVFVEEEKENSRGLTFHGVCLSFQTALSP